LIQKRNKPPEEFGGIWACTGGSATSGENSSTTAIREMEEEMGIDIAQKDLTLLNSLKESDHFVDIYISKWNGSIEDVTIDPDEVLDAKWISIADMKAMIADKTLYNYGTEYLEKVISHINISNSLSKSESGVKE
jgi:8-oxo-dGTP pyrophosphatase MutT (NUDIX family)